MTVNIYDNAHDMSKTLRKTQQFQELQAAFQSLKADAIGFGLFQEMQKTQMALAQKDAQHQEISDDEIQKMRDLSEKLGKIEAVQQLMVKEREMNQVMEEVNQIVSQPIVDLYRGV